MYENITVQELADAMGKDVGKLSRNRAENTASRWRHLTHQLIGENPKRELRRCTGILCRRDL